MSDEPSHHFVSPTPAQQRVMWSALTGVSWALLVAIFLILCFAAYYVISIIYPVLLPLGVAAIIAFIIDPVLVWMERLGLGRLSALIITCFLALLAAIIFVLLIFPPLVSEAMNFFESLPATVISAKNWWLQWLADHPEVKDYVSDNLVTWTAEIPTKLTEYSSHLLTPLQTVFSWAGVTIGFLFVPIYVYFFLLEKERIAANWEKYLPMSRSIIRDEVVVVLSEVNRYLVIFFRGQIIVAAIIGVLTAVGLLMIGLPYALLIGFLAGILSLVPYLGVITSIVPAILVAYANSTTPEGAWLWPLAVIIVFVVVQTIEGTFITPKIMGDRTGLHPLTVIISILIWTLILPGLLGPILAVPLTATLRVLMYRYVWLEKPEDMVSRATPRTPKLA